MTPHEKHGKVWRKKGRVAPFHREYQVPVRGRNDLSARQFRQLQAELRAVAEAQELPR